MRPAKVRNNEGKINTPPVLCLCGTRICARWFEALGMPTNFAGPICWAELAEQVRNSKFTTGGRKNIQSKILSSLERKAATYLAFKQNFATNQQPPFRYWSGSAKFDVEDDCDWSRNTLDDSQESPSGMLDWSNAGPTSFWISSDCTKILFSECSIRSMSHKWKSLKGARIENVTSATKIFRQIVTVKKF